ncbi:MAG: RHS repeat-associated core domain-containing protein [Paludibacteraceae bacterium]|nr:RHS repeat-associated core domain-containing protein [Paludibacteraceae bacterium]
MHIEGKIGNNSIVYLDTIEYDNFDAQDIVEYGNGYITDYAYNNRRWLSNLYVHNQDDNRPLTLQDIYYSYDGVGNITNITQDAGVVLGISANYQENFDYDSQNRLRQIDISSDSFGDHGDYVLNYSKSGLLNNRWCEDWGLGVTYGYNHDNENRLINHRIRSLYDLYNDETYFLNWTADGQSYYTAILNTAEELQNDIDETYYSPDGWGYDQLQWECMDEEEWTIQNYAVSDSNIIKKTLKFFPIHQPILQEQRYFYHTDHLGSSSWITDSLGMPIQFIHYQPYGELYINYKTTAYDERFKFTGKERDAETDYDYFGARYYASICPSWISVDPLADNYPGLNLYAYCGWNPVMYVIRMEKEFKF